MSERPSPLDALVDLAVYAPVGLALTLAEGLPGLIAKGRAKVEPQLGTARVVGQFVVAEGRRRFPLLHVFGGAGGTSTVTPPPAPAEPGPAPRAPVVPLGTDPPGSTVAPVVPLVTEAPGSVVPPVIIPLVTDALDTPLASVGGFTTTDVPTAEGLAIPGYDSLSASQVVQRLAGLAPGELAAVGSYEASTRGRRTILSRVAQLQSR